MVAAGHRPRRPRARPGRRGAARRPDGHPEPAGPGRDRGRPARRPVRRRRAGRTGRPGARRRRARRDRLRHRDGRLRRRARGEFAVLTALGAPRRALTRTVPAQQAVLGVLGLTTGLALGALLVRLVVPLAVLTPQARRPVPAVVVQLPPGQVAVLAAVVCLALLVPAVLTGRRHAEAAARLRHLEDM
ncbi:FtsX-like permease family protein [Kitasatospora paranensis]|uniref:FtsX-like permease family protein n=1 Tax=Kitasatospora paranensis TaxID=258053 RepID=UPI003CD0B959